MAAFGLVLGLLLYSVISLEGLPPVALVVVASLPLVFWLYLAAGLIAWSRRPRNRVGLLLVWVSLTVWVIGAYNTTVPALHLVGTLFPSMVSAALVHLLLAFPTGRLSTRTEQCLVAAMYAVVTVFHAPMYLFDPEATSPSLAITDAPELAAAFVRVQLALGNAVAAAVAVVLIVRLRNTRTEHQRLLGPVYAYGVFVLLFVPALGWWWGRNPLLLGSIQIIAIAVFPLAVLATFLRGGFRHAAELEALGAWLGQPAASRTPIGAALAAALGDDSLVVAYRSTELRSWVHDDGTLVDGYDLPEGRGRYEIAVDGSPVARVEYDAVLLSDAGEVEQAVGLVSLALERERLTADLRASRQAVIESRERLAEAADTERRRISRGLHDGLQARLLLIGIAAERIAGATRSETPEQLAARAVALRDDTDDAASELRAIVEDLVPPALIELGVAGAVGELVDAMPVPTTLSADVPERIPESVEAAAYLVVAEALANVVKHSEAASAAVTLRAAGGFLHVVITDDGVGLDTPAVGTGLAGIADRVGATGGTSTAESLPEGGTRVWARIPLGS